MPRCGIVILAAGGSTRMGVAKQSLQYQGSTLLARAVETALHSQCRPVIVVLGAKAQLMQESLQDRPVSLVINPTWQAGIGTSISAGVKAIDPNSVDAVLLFLCDQPLVTAPMLNEMLESHFGAGKLITAAFYNDTLGTPAIFTVALINELQTLGDDQGGKTIIRRHADGVNRFPLPQAGTDVDTLEDFARLPGNF